MKTNPPTRLPHPPFFLPSFTKVCDPFYYFFKLFIPLSMPSLGFFREPLLIFFFVHPSPNCPPPGYPLFSPRLITFFPKVFALYECGWLCRPPSYKHHWCKFDTHPPRPTALTTVAKPLKTCSVCHRYLACWPFVFHFTVDPVFGTFVPFPLLSLHAETATPLSICHCHAQTCSTFFPLLPGFFSPCRTYVLFFYPSVP